MHGQNVLNLRGAGDEHAVLHLGRPDVLQPCLQVDHGGSDILLARRLHQDLAADLVEAGQGIVEAWRRDAQRDRRGLVERAGLGPAHVSAQLDRHGADSREGIGDVVDLEGDLSGLHDLALVLGVLRFWTRRLSALRRRGGLPCRGRAARGGCGRVGIPAAAGGEQEHERRRQDGHRREAPSGTWI